MEDIIEHQDITRYMTDDGAWSYRRSKRLQEKVDSFYDFLSKMVVGYRYAPLKSRLERIKNITETVHDKWVLEFIENEIKNFFNSVIDEENTVFQKIHQFSIRRVNYTIERMLEKKVFNPFEYRKIVTDEVIRTMVRNYVYRILSVSYTHLTLPTIA